MLQVQCLEKPALTRRSNSDINVESLVASLKEGPADAEPTAADTSQVATPKKDAATPTGRAPVPLQAPGLQLANELPTPANKVLLYISPFLPMTALADLVPLQKGRTSSNFSHALLISALILIAC